MHIELTDHLKCPGAHDEQFLVLLPGQVEGRRVVAGHLGCPFCGWSTAWEDGVPTFGEAPSVDDAEPPFDADAVLAMLGLEGPGGWVALAGRAAHHAEAIVAALPGVRLVAVNPPGSLVASDSVSVVRSAAWPIKRHAMRGVVLGADAAGSASSGLASVLPGLRCVGEGEPPPLGTGDQLLGAVAGLWVVRKG
ncbi:MAG TPA: hypothetical protein VFN90_02385 [Gemmatimonadales bacterium]|nr:hypothetical protein [Gemmatimonadales bacterium]